MLRFIESGPLKDHNFRFMILTTAVISANRENYACAYCSGVATTTDYIESIKDNPELLLSLDKLVAICRPCNSRKGSKSKGFFSQAVYPTYLYHLYLRAKSYSFLKRDAPNRYELIIGIVRHSRPQLLDCQLW